MIPKAITFDQILVLIGNKIYVARHIRREKITTAAANIGISHPVLSQIENGRYKSLSIHTLFKVCDYYDIHLQDMLAGVLVV
jgi:DNA-binding Xre family transcriptional regulator